METYGLYFINESHLGYTDLLLAFILWTYNAYKALFTYY